MCSCCSQEKHLLHFSIAVFKENCLCVCDFQVNIAVLFKAYSVVKDYLNSRENTHMHWYLSDELPGKIV